MMSMKPPVLVSIFACVVSWVLAFLAMPGAPTELPIHWGLDSRPDVYTDSTTALLLTPIIQTHLTLLLLVIARAVKPPAARGPTAWASCALIASLTWIEMTFVLRVWGRPVLFDSAVAIAMAMPMIAIGLLLPKVPPNPVFGIRLARTLRDPAIWRETHRRSARWIVGGGVGLIATSPLTMPLWVRLLLFVGGPFVVTVVLAHLVTSDE